jgi:Na+/proline symporter
MTGWLFAAALWVVGMPMMNAIMHHIAVTDREHSLARLLVVVWPLVALFVVLPERE